MTWLRVTCRMAQCKQHIQTKYKYCKVDIKNCMPWGNKCKPPTLTSVVKAKWGMWQQRSGMVRKYVLAKAWKSKCLFKRQLRVLTVHEMTDCLSHHVLAFLRLAVRSKKASQAFSSKFLNQTFAVYKELFFFFFFKWEHKSFPCLSKILFSDSVEIEINEKFNRTPEGYTCWV